MSELKVGDRVRIWVSGFDGEEGEIKAQTTTCQSLVQICRPHPSMPYDASIWFSHRYLEKVDGKSTPKAPCNHTWSDTGIPGGSVWCIKCNNDMDDV